MRNIAIPVLSAAVVGLAAPAAAQEKLIVYTYEGFTSEWGTGPVVEKAFEAECGCDLSFVSVADGVAVLNRLKLEGKDSAADIVLGIDNSLVYEAKQTGLFAPHGVSLDIIEVPGGWEDDVFVPFDYGYYAVIYNSDTVKNPPTSLKELVEGDASQKIAIQDPRTSTPGLGLLLWIKAVYGENSGEAWADLKDRVLTVTPGWSESYGLFTSGEAQMVLSYTTSPAYHRIADNEERYKAAEFAEGHYLQVEVAGMTAKGAENPLAKRFLEFMTGPAFQDAVPETNWMFPAGRTDKPLNPVFSEMIRPEEPLEIPSDVVAQNRKAWVDEWLQVMSR